MKNIYLIFTAILFSGCASLGMDKTSLNGMVYNSQNEGVSGVEIILNTGKKTRTDIYGHFCFDNLKMGKEYTVTAKGIGYGSSSINFYHNAASQVVYMNLKSLDDYISMACSSIAKGEYIEAEKILQTASEIEDSSLDVNYLSAICAYKTGNTDKAVSILTDEMTEYRDNKWVIALLHDIVGEK